MPTPFSRPGSAPFARPVADRVRALFTLGPSPRITYVSSGPPVVRKDWRDAGGTGCWLLVLRPWSAVRTSAAGWDGAAVARVDNDPSLSGRGATTLTAEFLAGAGHLSRFLTADQWPPSPAWSRYCTGAARPATRVGATVGSRTPQLAVNQAAFCVIQRDPAGTSFGVRTRAEGNGITKPSSRSPAAASPCRAPASRTRPTTPTRSPPLDEAIGWPRTSVSGTRFVATPTSLVIRQAGDR